MVLFLWFDANVAYYIAPLEVALPATFFNFDARYEPFFNAKKVNFLPFYILLQKIGANKLPDFRIKLLALKCTNV